MPTDREKLAAKMADAYFAAPCHDGANPMSAALSVAEEAFARREGEVLATVINDNQPGWTAIIETAPNVTLEVGTKLYGAPPMSERREAEIRADEREACAKVAEGYGRSEEIDGDGGETEIWLTGRAQGYNDAVREAASAIRARVDADG